MQSAAELEARSSDGHRRGSDLVTKRATRAIPFKPTAHTQWRSHESNTARQSIIDYRDQSGKMRRIERG